MCVETLMEKFEVTERTIRNDIRELNYSMPEGIKVNISDGGKLRVSGKEDFSAVVAKLLADQSDYYHYRLSAEERRSIITLILLYSSHYVTTAYLADKLSVSKNTIVSETENLKEVFEERGLKLESKTRRGFRTMGDEKEIRRFIYELCEDNSENNKNSTAYRTLFRRELEGDVERKAIFDILCEWENSHDFELTDQSFEELENYLLVIANRINNGNILLEPYSVSTLNVSLASELLRMVLAKIGKSSDAIVWAESPALNRLILGCRYIRKNFEEKLDSFYTEMRILAFIYDICRRLDIAQKINYEKFYFIFVHINSAVERIRQGQGVARNAFHEELKIAYPQIFTVVRQESETLKELVDGAIDDEELSYIAMYFIAVLEEKEEAERPIRAVLVCSSGMCTAMLLQAKLKLHFNIEIVNVLSAHKYEQYDLTGVDLIISTVYLERMECPTACINPILADSDIETIHNTIGQIKYERKRHEESRLQTQIREYIAEYRNLTRSLRAETDLYRHTVEEFYNKYFGGDSEEENNLYSLLEEEFIVMDGNAQNWEEAVRISGELLAAKGIVEPRYVDSLVRIIRKNGPYCVFIPHVALAHAAPEDGSEKAGFSLVRLREPVEFYHPSNDPVQIVVCISGGRDRDYLKPFFHLVRIFQNREVLEFILSAEHPEEIINIIRFYEKFFFDQ